MTAPSPAAATAARNAVFVVFAVNGFAFASWAARIPDIKRLLDLTAGQLGVTLLFGSLGSLLALPLSGRVVERVGAKGAVRSGGVAVAAGAVVVAVTVETLQHRWLTAAALFVTMAGVALWDVAMNHEGAAVEQQLGRTVMPLFHALFSAGTVAGALAAVVVIKVGTPMLLHLAVVGVVALVATAVAPRRFLTGWAAEVEGAADETAPPAGSPAWREPRVLLIGLVTLVAALTEGTANDWVAVAVTEGHDQESWVGVLAFATFLSAMTVGRVVGARLLDRYGRVPVLRALFVLAGIGSVLVVFGSLPLVFVGTVLWGVGASLGFPVGMSAAADDPARAAARLSVVSTIGYVAFLVGPPALGLLGDHVGVLRALLVVGVLVIPALLAVPAVRERGRAVSHRAGEV